MPFTDAANARTADDLAWLEKKLDGIFPPGRDSVTTISAFG
jgi:hypothetical protein